jgi:hypothetical protein
MRWPGYTITGAGPLVVALHCARRVLLVMTPLEARALAANRCCADCSHAVAPAGGWHTIHKLDAQRNEAPRRSMRRLPGWDED